MRRHHFGDNVQDASWRRHTGGDMTGEALGRRWHGGCIREEASITRDEASCRMHDRRCIIERHPNCWYISICPHASARWTRGPRPRA